MPLENLIVPEAILPSLRVNGKKQALQELSEKAAEVYGLPAREIFDAWMQREKLNSTGLGDGIAIPHGKLVNVPRIFGIFAPAGAPDRFRIPRRPAGRSAFRAYRAGNRRGRIISRLSAIIARLLRNPAMVAKIRATREAPALYSLLTQASPSSDAA